MLVTEVIEGFQLKVVNGNLRLVRGSSDNLVIPGPQLSLEVTGARGVATASQLAHCHGVPYGVAQTLVDQMAKKIEGRQQ